MAKKPAPKASKSVAAPVTPPAAKSSPVRNSPIPKEPVAKAAVAAPAARKIFTQSDIAVAAYYLSRSPEAGDQLHNWLTAENRLKSI